MILRDLIIATNFCRQHFNENISVLVQVHRHTLDINLINQKME